MWALKHTGRPFGPCEKMSVSDFKFEISRHRTYGTARIAMSKIKTSDNSDGFKWWDHANVFPLRPHNMTAMIECLICGEEHRVRFTWNPDEVSPLLSLEDKPCPSCRERRAGMTPIEEYEDMVRYPHQTI